MIKKLQEKYKALPIQFKASLWFLICLVLQKGISVLTTPIFSRLMSTEQYGDYNVFNSWENVLAVFVTMRLYYGVYTQGLIKFDKIRDEFSSALQGLTLTMTGFWTLVYIVGHNYWNWLLDLSTSAMVAMFVTIWATAVFKFWAAEQRTRYKYVKLVIISLAVSLMKPALGITLVMMTEDKTLARIWAFAIVELIGYVWLFFVQMRKGKVFFSKKIWLYALRFNIPLIPHYLSQTVLSSSDRIMIKKMVDSGASGIYSLSYQISMLMLLFTEALQQTLAPWIYQKIKQRNFKRLDKIVYVSLVLVALANLMLIIIAPEAVAIFAPKSYHDAIWIIPPVAMSTFFIFLYNVFSFFEFYFEKSKLIAISTMGAAVANVLLNYVFISRFGYYAAGYTTLVCYILYAILHSLVMISICKKEFNNPRILNPFVLLIIAVIFMVCGFTVMLLYRTVWIRYVIVLAMLIAAFLMRDKLIGFYKMLKKRTDS